MKTDWSGLNGKILLFFISALVATGLMLFMPAGSLDYWQAWVFIGVLFIPIIFVMLYLLKHDRGLLERRMQFSEKEAQQKTIISISKIVFFIGFLIPGFDHRFGWSNVPIFIIIMADIIILLGYLLVFFVFKENTYTSRIIEVEKKQKVIASGPYSLIRHPMYAGMISMFIFMPLALGSYWALACFIPMVILIILRLFNEEQVLLRDLKGYKAYCRKVRYRLIPGLW
jgi:protein-S-isoprenylcysteine O-methyltransferase Ste14